MKGIKKIKNSRSEIEKYLSGDSWTIVSSNNRGRMSESVETGPENVYI